MNGLNSGLTSRAWNPSRPNCVRFDEPGLGRFLAHGGPFNAANKRLPRPGDFLFRPATHPSPVLLLADGDALAPPPSRQGRRRRLPLQAPRCCLLPLPFPSPPRPPRASRPHGSTIFLANPPRSRSARCRCVELDFELVCACAPAAAACGARSGTRLAWGSKRSPPRTSLELCPIQIFLGVHLAAQFRFFLFLG